MWTVSYYRRKRGDQPVAEWLDGLDINSRAVSLAKIEKLSEYGLELLATDMLTTISGDDSDFYELRGGQCRIGTYYDRRRATFVLLHGWLKKKPLERREIKQARHLLHEYLLVQGG